MQNLLDTTRLEFGAVPLKVESCDMQDLIGTALAQLGESARKRQIAVEIPILAAQAGMPAVALTDPFSLVGAVEFVHSARRCGVKPLVGTTIEL